MDALTIGLLLAGAALTAILIYRRNASANQIQYSPALPRRHQERQRKEAELDLDQQTRFVESPRRKQYRLLNDAEQVLFRRLCEAMPNMRIFAQVGVTQLALLRGRQEAQRLMQLSGRGVDFVVCDADFAIIAAIELSWPLSGDQNNASEDEKRQALHSLGVPLIVFRPNSLPDADTICREIADAVVRRNRLEAERN
jgi:hypothetical protein